MKTHDVTLSRVSSDNLNDADDIFRELETYSLRVDGRSRRTGAAHQFATALPPGCNSADKHAFVAYRQNWPVGLLDIIDGYPATGTAFIGLLAVRESAQGIGIGHALYDQAEQFVQADLRARTVRLGIVETNPVIGFWRKMGFRPTGEVKPHAGEAIGSRIILMEKGLSSTAE